MKRERGRETYYRLFQMRKLWYCVENLEQKLQGTMMKMKYLRRKTRRRTKLLLLYRVVSRFFFIVYRLHPNMKKKRRNKLSDLV